MNAFLSEGALCKEILKSQLNAKFVYGNSQWTDSCENPENMNSLMFMSSRAHARKKRGNQFVACAQPYVHENILRTRTPSSAKASSARKFSKVSQMPNLYTENHYRADF